MNSKVHEFVAGDKSHPQSERIYEVLCKINLQFKIAMHVQIEHLEMLKPNKESGYVSSSICACRTVSSIIHTRMQYKYHRGTAGPKKKKAEIHFMSKAW